MDRPDVITIDDGKRPLDTDAPQLGRLLGDGGAESMRIRLHDVGQPVGALSGGNQQKVTSWRRVPRPGERIGRGSDR